MRVRCINPEQVRNIALEHGRFARICYDTDEKHAERVGEACMESGHWSGSRCEYIKFEIRGIDRGTAEQCLRHEIGVRVPPEMLDNWELVDATDMERLPSDEIVKNMASFRYIDKTGFAWATPRDIRDCCEAEQRYEALMHHIERERRGIKRLLEESGVPAAKATEAANFVLPRATCTELVIGMTPEALIWFCGKRMCARASEFARELALEMRIEISRINPMLAAKMQPQCERLLYCPEGKRGCGRWPTRSEARRLLDEAHKRLKAKEEEEK